MNFLLNNIYELIYYLDNTKDQGLNQDRQHIIVRFILKIPDNIIRYYDKITCSHYYYNIDTNEWYY